MKNVFLLSFCFCVQNDVFLLKIVCKEKKYTKRQPKKNVCGILNFGSTKLNKPTWYYSYYSKLKKKKKKTS